MTDTAVHVFKIYKAKTWYRELWSDFCTFAVVVAQFAVGWWFDSSAMQWFAFVTAFLLLFSKARDSVKSLNAQEAADYLKKEFSVTAQ